MASLEQQERVAILLIAHGSRHSPANDDLHHLADRFARSREYSIVEACFLELAEPDIATGGERCIARGATQVLMIPYFLSAGVHLLRDLTAARDALQLRHPRIDFRLASALGPDPLLDELVRRRIQGLGMEKTPPALASTTEMASRYAPMDHHPTT
ncbi:MAG: CbiX/SirB N-terminal domain-containing protein [Isosphaeraceae bacterium]